MNPDEARVAEPQVPPIGFSAEATAEFQKKSTDFVVALEQASMAVAKRKNADSVSAHHVRMASDSLGQRRSKSARHLENFGSLLMGGGISYLVGVILASAYTFSNAVYAFAPMFVGAILYSYGSQRE